MKNILECNNHEYLLSYLNDKENFYKYIANVNNEFDNLSNNKIEYIIKIIFIKIIFFFGNVNTNDFEIFYKKLEKKNDYNLKLLNKLIFTYDKYSFILSNLESLCYIIIISFSKKIKKLKKYLNDIKLNLNIIDKIINNEVLKYYNSFFELNYDKMFFKRIYEYKKYSIKSNINELIVRINKIVKIFGLKLLNELNIEIITLYDFSVLSYLEKINYFMWDSQLLIRFYFTRNKTIYNRCNKKVAELS